MAIPASLTEWSSKRAVTRTVNLVTSSFSRQARARTSTLPLSIWTRSGSTEGVRRWETHTGNPVRTGALMSDEPGVPVFDRSDSRRRSRDHRGLRVGARDLVLPRTRGGTLGGWLDASPIRRFSPTSLSCMSSSRHFLGETSATEIRVRFAARMGVSAWPARHRWATRSPTGSSRASRRSLEPVPSPRLDPTPPTEGSAGSLRSRSIHSPFLRRYVFMTIPTRAPRRCT